LATALRMNAPALSATGTQVTIVVADTATGTFTPIHIGPMLPGGARAPVGREVPTPSLRQGGTVELFTDAKGPKVTGAVGVGPTDPKAVALDARSMPNIPSNSQATVVANNPFILPGEGGTFSMMDFLPESARITAPGGRIVINGTNANAYLTKVPTPEQLEKLGLKVQYQGPILEEYQGLVFSRSDGSRITAPMQSLVFVKK
jgi:filamentous hemagglutinin